MFFLGSNGLSYSVNLIKMDKIETSTLNVPRQTFLYKKIIIITYCMQSY